MNKPIPKYLKRKDSSLLYNSAGGDYMCYYIPDNYFNDKIAFVDGNIVSTIGVFNYARFGSNDKPLDKLYLFTYPARIRMIPSEIHFLKNTKLTKDSAPRDYRVLIFKNDDVVLENVNIKKSIEDAEVFLDMLITAKLPDTIPYDEIQHILNRSIELSGNSYPVNMQILGLIISVLYRDSNDIRTPYRKVKNKTMLNYSTTSIKNVPKFANPYTAIVSEDIDQSLVSAINTSNMGNLTPSPLEKTFRP